MKTTKRRLTAAALALAAVLTFAVSCADSSDSDVNDTTASAGADNAPSETTANGTETDSIEADTTESETTEDAYAGYDAVEYVDAGVTKNLSDGISGDWSYGSTYAALISSAEEWEAVSSTIGLTYDDEFFDENALIIVEYNGSGSADISGMTHLVIIDSKLVPVIGQTVLIDGDETTDIVYWFVVAEVALSDIEGYVLGGAEVEITYVS
ncbi:MAG: hypothetical protein LUI61_03670 [Firmicutes bacterium]|nr:hypothetical protein [Bacillota bacterium]